MLVREIEADGTLRGKYLDNVAREGSDYALVYVVSDGIWLQIYHRDAGYQPTTTQRQVECWDDVFSQLSGFGYFGVDLYVTRLGKSFVKFSDYHWDDVLSIALIAGE